jgi:DNA-binding MarR family transcriptional regulator
MKLTINQLGQKIRNFSEYLQRAGAALFEEAFKIQGVRNLSVMQLRYLELIEGNPGISPGNLASIFSVKKPTVTNVISQLERDGLIERERGGDDKRVCFLHPTGTTKAIFKKRRGMYVMLASHIAGKLDKSEIGELLRLFDKITIEEGMKNG